MTCKICRVRFIATVSFTWVSCILIQIWHRSVDPSAIVAFSDSGKRLLVEMGPDALAAAIALLSGLDQTPPDRSLLCGKEGTLTVLVRIFCLLQLKIAWDTLLWCTSVDMHSYYRLQWIACNLTKFATAGIQSQFWSRFFSFAKGCYEHSQVNASGIQAGEGFYMRRRVSSIRPAI